MGRGQLGPDRGSKGQMGSRHLEKDGGGWGTGVGVLEIGVLGWRGVGYQT